MILFFVLPVFLNSAKKKEFIHNCTSEAKIDLIKKFPSQLDVFSSINAPISKSKDAQLAKKSAESFLQNTQVKFLENKGQLTDLDGNAVPFVLFKTEAPGTNLFVTEKGLTYMFFKNHKEAIPENPLTHEEKQFLELSGEGIGYNKYLTWERIDMDLPGAIIKKENIIKEGESSYFKQYFLAHCPNGISNVREYEKITIKNIYPGIDWVLYNSSENGFKYDFVVHPGGNPNDIKLIYKSNKPLQIDSIGSIIIEGGLGSLNEHAPYSYIQETNQPVSSGFVKKNIDKFSTEITFSLSAYSQHQNTLVIDPQLVWSTYFGGNGADGPKNICIDANDNLYIVGYTQSTASFPVQSSGGYFNNTISSVAAYDAHIAKFNSAGALLWSTYYGGTADDKGFGICTDNSNNLFVVGHTSSTNFPVQNSGTFFQAANAGSWDVFILKFNSTGVRQWATYFGGTLNDNNGANGYGLNIACDGSNVFIGGSTVSSNFPTQNLAGAYFQAAKAGGARDQFIIKFNNMGTLLWSTYLGGSSDDECYTLAINTSGNVVFVGRTQSANFPTQNLAGAYFQVANAGSSDMTITEFTNVGVLIWSTYYGDIGFDEGHDLNFDSSGNLYIVGSTLSASIPLQNPGGGAYYQASNAGTWDLFILQFNTSRSLIWGTYYGGSNTDHGPYKGERIYFDSCDNLYISGSTKSSDFPLLASCNSFNDLSYGGSSLSAGDAFILKFNSSHILLWGTYNGTGNDDWANGMAIDSFDNLIVVGEWRSTNDHTPINPGGGAFYQANNNGNDDIFILKFTPTPPTFSQSQVNNVSCACNGIATISVTCGEALFSYYWSNSVVQANVTNTTSSINGLCDGVYDVTVTANCNQTYTTSYTIVGCVLPVVLLDFSAINEGDRVKLNWATSSEHNSNYFKIEKSTDTEIWEHLGIVAAAGTSSSYRPYYLYDNNPLPNSNAYYKLSLYDKGNNSPTSTRIAVINFSRLIEEPEIYPNPTEDIVTIKLTNKNASGTISIYNNLGQIIFNQSTSPNGINTINMKALPQGIYYLDLGAIHEKHYKIIKQ